MGLVIHTLYIYKDKDVDKDVEQNEEWGIDCIEEWEWIMALTSTPKRRALLI